MEFVHKREKERSKNALRRVYGGNKKVVYGGGEVPTCHGHTNVAKGLGAALLAQVNQLGGPINTNAYGEEGIQPIEKIPHHIVEQMTVNNIVERRQRRDHKYRGKVWDDHVTSLHATDHEALLQRQREYNDRRRHLREHLNDDQKPVKKSSNTYIPTTMASQHAIALGMPHNKRKEYDERRAWLKSNLTEEEKLHLAKKRGEHLT